MIFFGTIKSKFWEGSQSCSKAHLKEAEVRHGAVAGPVALGRGPLPEAVAPPLHHVKSFGMPDVSLQPYVLLLSTVKFQRPVYVTSSGFVAFIF